MEQSCESSRRMEIEHVAVIPNSEKDEPYDASRRKENDDLLECDKHEESRPKRGSRVTIKIKNGKILESVHVKNVGKKSTAKKNTCWVETNDSVEEINFQSDVDSWRYEKKL